MEDLPPSYESAIDREPWKIIAPWVASSDLVSACLVSHKWHAIFAPNLWGNPAAHLGTEHDPVSEALTRFRKNLCNVRLMVRQMTHTLHHPPGLCENYGRPNGFWLRHVLESLPNLQSLIVSSLPFFDHDSLVALRQTSNVRPRSVDNRDDQHQYDLKLLLAEEEPNATPSGLREALFHFQRLVYLDLSYTIAAKYASVLSVLEYMLDLQVLKLRGIGMRDQEAEVLTKAIGLKVRLLDVRQNHLTDKTVKSLLQTCFLPSRNLQAGNAVECHQIENWPVDLAPAPTFLSLDILRSEDLDQALLKQFTHPLTGRLASERIPHCGLTHLYITDNVISVEGLCWLLSSTRLRSLDAGTVETAKNTSRAMSSSSFAGSQTRFPLSGRSRLFSVLQTSVAQSLTHLRIDHALIMDTVTTKDSFPSIASRFPESTVADNTPAPAYSPVKRAFVSRATSETFTERKFQESEEPRGWNHNEWSPTSNALPHPNGMSNLNAAEQTRERREATEHQGSPDGSIKGEEDNKLRISNAPKSRLSMSSADRIKKLLQKRPLDRLLPASSQGSLKSSESGPHNQYSNHLHPYRLSNLRTLILTNVPTHVPESSSLTLSLLHFISACADEAHLASLQAQTNYSLPPGYRRHAAEIRHARSLFALRTIVLEMRNTNSGSAVSGTPNMRSAAEGGRAWNHGQARPYMLKSSTGDTDSEALWAAAENDFSFFSDDGDKQNAEYEIYGNGEEDHLANALSDEVVERSEPDLDTDQNHGQTAHHTQTNTSPSNAAIRAASYSSISTTTPVATTKDQNSKDNKQGQKDGKTPTMVDVVSELSQFRNAKRKEYQAAVAAAAVAQDGQRSKEPALPVFVQGYWDGKIKIVR